MIRRQPTPLLGLCIVLGLGLTIPTLTWAGTALGDLATSMQPGTWAELQTNNLLPTISEPASSAATHSIFPYSEDGVWDTVSRQFFFIGSDHWHTPGGYAKFIAYSENTNSWQVMPRPSWFTSLTETAQHGYDHSAINSQAGYLYHQKPCCDPPLWRYTIASETWTQLPGPPAGYQIFGALEPFPEMGGLVYIQGGALQFFNEATTKWSTLATGLSMGDYHNFAEYNPVHKVVIFGGGNGSGAMYKLDASGKITSLATAPFSLRVNSSIVTVDPVSGDYLIFGGTGQFYVYDVISNKWTLQNTPNPITSPPNYNDEPVALTIAAPIKTYGVTMFVKHLPLNQGWVYLYKHKASPPPDLSPPAAPRNLTLQ